MTLTHYILLITSNVSQLVHITCYPEDNINYIQLVLHLFITKLQTKPNILNPGSQPTTTSETCISLVWPLTNQGWLLVKGGYTS